MIFGFNIPELPIFTLYYLKNLLNVVVFYTYIDLHSFFYLFIFSNFAEASLTVKSLQLWFMWSLHHKILFFNLNNYLKSACPKDWWKDRYIKNARRGKLVVSHAIIRRYFRPITILNQFYKTETKTPKVFLTHFSERRQQLLFLVRLQKKEYGRDIISHSNTIDGWLAFRTLTGPLSPLTLSTKRLPQICFTKYRLSSSLIVSFSETCNFCTWFESLLFLLARQED